MLFTKANNLGFRKNVLVGNPDKIFEGININFFAFLSKIHPLPSWKIFDLPWKKVLGRPWYLR